MSPPSFHFMVNFLMYGHSVNSFSNLTARSNPLLRSADPDSASLRLGLGLAPCGQHPVVSSLPLEDPPGADEVVGPPGA